MPKKHTIYELTGEEVKKLSKGETMSIGKIKIRFSNDGMEVID